MAPRPPQFPNHWERIGIDAIRQGKPLPSGVAGGTIAKLLRKGWVKQGATRGSFIITEEGNEAMKRKIPSVR